MADFLFYALSALSVAFGVGVVSARRPIMSVLSLLGSFVCLAVIYLLAGYQFLAAAQLLVYAGAIMVLFLFVIMLLEQGSIASSVVRPVLQTSGPRKALVAGAVALGLALAGVLAATRSDLPGASEEPLAVALDPVDAIATQLFTRYLLPFEAAALLLLATMVGVLVLAKRHRGPTGASPSGPGR